MYGGFKEFIDIMRKNCSVNQTYLPGEHVLRLDDELRQIPQARGRAQLPHHVSKVI